jgi:hypothetical protein
MKWVLWLLALPVLLNAVQASVVISQVFYDPAGTESGGEAVEISNGGSSAVDIGKWVLATESSAADATIPEGTMLAPGQSFLIADSGWSSAKDNPAWKSADLEETITMANSDSGIALKDSSGAVIDAVGWGNPAGIKQGLYEGTPASQVQAGKALSRTQDTGNNAADFSEAEPMFFSGEAVAIIANVTNLPVSNLPIGAALDEDDGAEPGVQLKPVAGGTRALHLKVYYNGSSVSASGFGTTTALAKESGVWKGGLALEYWSSPGQQQVVVSTDSGNTTITATVLEISSARVETKSVLLKASPGSTADGEIRVVNEGNIPVEVSWIGDDLVFGNASISFENLVIVSRKIMPKETGSIDVKLNIPENAAPGEYRAIVRMNEQ